MLMSNGLTITLQFVQPRWRQVMLDFPEERGDRDGSRRNMLDPAYSQHRCHDLPEG